MITRKRFYLICILSAVFFCANAQNVLEQRVIKDYSGYQLTEAFVDLENKLGIRFFSKQSWIDQVKVPELPTNISLRDFIELTLDEHKLSHIEVQGINIILIPARLNLPTEHLNQSSITPIGNALERGKYKLNTVEGYVRFGKTGMPINGATVINNQHNKQTISGRNGHYSIDLPGGVTKLQFSFIGHESKTFEVDVLSHGQLDCELFDSLVQIEAVNISAFGGKNNVENTQMGVAYIDRISLEKLPTMMGEADIIKGMTLLPGVQTTTELSAGFSVRGGSIDQNQVLIDGAPLYNTSHLFGLFSTLIPEAINNVELHKGTQPANYGSRLSSIMDIRLIKPSNEKLTGRASLGLTSYSMFVEGPAIKDFCTFSLGARTTYGNWMLRNVRDVDINRSEASFYDLIGSLAFNLNPKNKLKIFGYSSSDLFEFSDKSIYTYGSVVGGLNYQLLLSDHLSMNFKVSQTDYKSSLSTVEIPYLASTLNTGINHSLAKLEFGISYPRHDIIFGAEGSNFNLNLGDTEKYGDISSTIERSIDVEKALEMSGFIYDDFRLSENMNIMLGLRYSWYSKYGEATSYIYDPELSVSDFSVTDSIFHGDGEFVSPYSGFEPRLGFRYLLNSRSSIKGGYHVSRQYQHLISNTSVPTPVDYWKSADLNIKPMMSQQFSLGYFRNFLDNVIETSAEIYYKQITNTIGYRNGAVLSMNPTIERDLLQGFSKAYGLEVMIKKNSGKVKGWLSYTLSKSLMKIDSDRPEDRINDGSFFPASYDRPHDVSATVNYQITRRLNISGNFLYSSGVPVTYPEKKFKYRLAEVVHFSDRNKYRLDPYHRLDLALTYDGFVKKTKKVHPSFTFSIYNVYGNKNYYSVYFKKDVPSAINNYNLYGLYKLSVIGAPIPTLKLNLKF